MIKDYKKRDQISQDSVNNNDWGFWQTASGAIAIIIYALIFTAINLLG